MLTAETEETTVVTTKIIKSIDEISPIEWNRIFPNVLEDYYFFKTLDESGFDQFSFRYILVYNHENLIGATTCFLMNYPLDTTVSGPIKILIHAIKKIFPNFLNLKAVICGIPMGQGRIGFMDPYKDIAVDGIASALEELAKSEKASIIAFKDFGGPYLKILGRLKTRGYCRIENIPSTEMPVLFQNFEQYLKTLSRVSRDGLKRKFKKIDTAIKIDFEIAHDINDSLDDIYGLYLQTVAKGQFQFETVPKEFFRRISINKPTETKFFLWRIDGKLVAFAFCLSSDEWFIDYYLGFDYSLAYQYHLYFVRFRDLMNWCIKNGIKKYEMGNTNYEPKRRLGFNFIQLYVYAKHRSRWLNPFFKFLCEFLKPERFEKVFEDMKVKNQWVKAL